jgi:glycosyltransferase involved in cell wall biosynthesis
MLAMSSRAQPTVTIGMPVYNGVEFIEQALAAITEQTYENWRLFVSDNVSTDGTWDILQRWAAKDDRIILHQQDANIGAARNFQYVLDRAETDYFMWHAYDDWLAPNYLEELTGCLLANPDCTLACPTIDRLTAEGNPLLRVEFPSVLPPARLERVKYLLDRPEPAWIYGLFRTEALRRAQRLAASFGWVWGSDHVALVSFIVNDRICGTDRTIFFNRKLGLSAGRYGPATRIDRYRYIARYVWFHLKIWMSSRLSPLEKLGCVGRVLRHAVSTSCSRSFIKFSRRPIKTTVRALLGRQARVPK